MMTPLLSLTLHSKRDVLKARQCGRQVARLLGLAPPEQTHIAAAVFEIAYGACRSLGRASLHFQIADGMLRIFPAAIDSATIRGAAASKASRSRNATKLDTNGARRLMKRLQVPPVRASGQLLQLDHPLGESVPAVALEDLPWVSHQLAQLTPVDLFDEIRQQNLELLRALEQTDASRQPPSRPASAADDAAA